MIPAKQAAVILRSLKNYEKLKPAYVALKQLNQGYRYIRLQDSIAIQGQARTIDWYKDSFAVEQQLRQDADRKVILWRSKARKRGVILGVTFGVPAAYGGYRIGQALKLWK